MRLLHIIKMIFNVSSFYNTSERVASLLVKITNQVYIVIRLLVFTTYFLYCAFRLKLWNLVVEKNLTLNNNMLFVYCVYLIKFFIKFWDMFDYTESIWKG